MPAGPRDLADALPVLPADDRRPGDAEREAEHPVGVEVGVEQVDVEVRLVGIADVQVGREAGHGQPVLDQGQRDPDELLGGPGRMRSSRRRTPRRSRRRGRCRCPRGSRPAACRRRRTRRSRTRRAAPRRSGGRGRSRWPATRCRAACWPAAGPSGRRRGRGPPGAAAPRAIARRRGRAAGTCRAPRWAARRPSTRTETRVDVSQNCHMSSRRNRNQRTCWPVLRCSSPGLGRCCSGARHLTGGRRLGVGPAGLLRGRVRRGDRQVVEVEGHPGRRRVRRHRDPALDGLAREQLHHARHAVGRPARGVALAHPAEHAAERAAQRRRLGAHAGQHAVERSAHVVPPRVEHGQGRR